MEEIQGSAISSLINYVTRFIGNKWPWLTDDPVVVGMLVGFVIGCFLTWIVYRLVHQGKINGLNATIAGLNGEKNILERENANLERQLQKRQEDNTALQQTGKLQENEQKIIRRDYSDAILIEHERDNPDFYWESALMRGEHTPIDQILKWHQGDPDPEGYHHVQRTCRVRIINNTDETISDVVVRVEDILPNAERVMLPIQLRFTDETRTSIDLRPHEYRFVDVIYWRFPKERVSEAEWDYQYFICGVNKDSVIKQATYRLKLVAYGSNARAEKTLSVGKPPPNGSTHREIWMY